ncbi:prenylcysteine oxidase 1-like [Amphiura filiformis]|uniref:prenylcysteine oxidase 1-like n=1 Tax=Amphiura filiformis TaxID=82378 RepID=UPI003B21E724
MALNKYQTVNVLFTFTVILVCNFAQPGLSAPNIVIVGAGIGGSSCAYYLHQWIPQANITILEADDRIASSVDGGNSLLPKALINASKADVMLNSLVTSVTKDPGGYVVTYNKPSPQQLLADVVILAAPLEWTDIAFRNFPEDPASKQPRRTWTYWYVHYVSAKSLNNAYFNQPQNWNQPQDILTTSNASTTWATIQFITNNNGLNIYKLFCFQNITSTINKYFLGVKTVHVKYWKYTFPELMPIQKDSQFQDIELDDNLFNINTMESVASAMEGSVISGRNVAMIVKEKWP